VRFGSRNLNRILRPGCWAAIVLLGCTPLVAQVDVLTQHNDNLRSGTNLHETRLTVSNIKGHLAKLAYRVVDGNIYAQPLIVTRNNVANRTGPVDVAIVATEHNSVYAFDANDTDPASTNALLWHTGPEVLGTQVESAELYNAIGASDCSDLTTEIGITGTPVIQITKDTSPREGVVFLSAKSKSGDQYAYTLFALSLYDGTKIGELPITGKVPGNGNGSTNGAIEFSPMLELNRPALLLASNILYVAFGGHCDQGTYHGWLFAYDISNPKAIKPAGVFCATPNGAGDEDEGRAGIWMSGQGPAIDDEGNVYFTTGDGTYNGTTDFGDSVVKVKAIDGKIQVLDWFTPPDQEMLKTNDVDLGSTGVLLVPDSHLLIIGSKEGRMYLVDRDKMGKGATDALHSFQVTHDPDRGFYRKVFYNIHGTPVVWPRKKAMDIYVCGEEDPVKQYKLIPDNASGGAGWKFASDKPVKKSPESAPYPNYPKGMFGEAGREVVWMPGGFLSLSANGTGRDSGILWVTLPYSDNANHFVVRGILRAFDASDLSKGELWDSENTGNVNDRLGQFAKFCPPTVANGKVYVATFQQETVGIDGVHRKMAGGDQPSLAIYGLR